MHRHAVHGRLKLPSSSSPECIPASSDDEPRAFRSPRPSRAQRTAFWPRRPHARPDAQVVVYGSSRMFRAKAGVTQYRYAAAQPIPCEQPGKRACPCPKCRNHVAVAPCHWCVLCFPWPKSPRCLPFRVRKILAFSFRCRWIPEFNGVHILTLILYLGKFLS